MIYDMIWYVIGYDMIYLRVKISSGVPLEVQNGTQQIWGGQKDHLDAENGGETFLIPPPPPPPHHHPTPHPTQHPHPHPQPPRMMAVFTDTWKRGELMWNCTQVKYS